MHPVIKKSRLFRRSLAGPSVPLSVRGVALACGAVVFAWAGTLLLRSIVPDKPLSLVLFFVAVALSAGLGGLWSGVLATLLSALTCDYFFLTPVHSFAIAARDLPLLILFVLAASLVNGISGRLRAQKYMADQRYYQLVQGLDGIVWEVNPRTLAFTFVNRRAQLLLGYPIQDWIANADFRARITHPADAERMKALWTEALRTGGEHSADYRAITAGGAELWLRETIYVMRDAHGRATRITGLGIDITDRKAEADELMLMKDELSVLNEVTAALSGSLELKGFCSILRAKLAKSLGAQAGCLFLARDDEFDFQLVDAWGFPDIENGSDPLRELNPPFGQVLARQSDGLGPGSAISVLRPSLSAEARDLGWMEAVSLPLLSKDELCGALNLYWSRHSPSRYRSESFLTSVGRQVGTLLQNVLLYQQLSESRERLQQLSRQLVSVQEAERRAIARELHDEIGQQLTGLKLSLELGQERPAGTPGDQPHRALDLVRELIEQVDGLSLDLRPAMLDDLGLLPALVWHCKRYTGVTGVHVQLEHSGAETRLPPEIEVTAYRVIQEGLTNVARHAKVNSTKVRLWCTREIVRIQISDEGCGFDAVEAAENPLAAGLAGMRERAALLDGLLTVETAPGAGTLITVDLPIGTTCCEALTRTGRLHSAEKIAPIS